MPDIGPAELIIILVVVVLIFGGTRLAEVGGSLGKGVREFRKNIKDDDDSSEEQAAPAASAPPMSTNGVVSAVKCQNCGHLNPVGAKFCSECANPFPVQTG